MATLAVACTVPSSSPADDGQLKVGVLGILDTLPMYVADQEGYFKTQGITVELVPFKSALERDTAMQAGQIDGILNDLVSAALLNKDADKVRVVRVAMRPAPGKAMFRLLAAPQGKATRSAACGDWRSASPRARSSSTSPIAWWPPAACSLPT